MALVAKSFRLVGSAAITDDLLQSSGRSRGSGAAPGRGR
jgi:hypothetical protein